VNEVTQTEQDALRTAIRRAVDAHRASGRTGIVATILQGDAVVVSAENEVDQQNDPTRHAEMVALSQATALLGRKDLSDCTLISTLQPCEMCLSAMRFAGIRRVIFAATQANVAGKYFVFPGLGIQDFEDAGESFSHVGGVMEQDVLYLYAEGTE
jgi:tRNA(Arg) A34 adenosine deaminase TadA